MIGHRLIDPRAARRAVSAARVEDGRGALRPEIGIFRGADRGARFDPAAGQLDLLNNEDSRGAAAYPLRLAKGEFFTEVLGAANAAAADYEDLIHRSLSLLREAGLFRPMSLAMLYACGETIQTFDRDFAAARIGQALDDIHRCVGTDVDHPYAKTTICRTAFSVEVNGRIIPFFFEKFLVSYSYLDQDGRRRSTVTPAHSHPINFETGYFTHFGHGSMAIEQEFFLADADGTPLVDKANKVSATVSGKLDWNALRVLRIEPGPKTPITPGRNPASLPAFASEGALKAEEGRLIRFDGLFRPHRVEVIDDPDVPTRYFALDNYFGPACRVLVFDETGAVKKWRRNEWVGR